MPCAIQGNTMKIAVLNIGNEILKGTTTNTNLVAIGQELVKLGIPPVLQITVNDTKQDIQEAIRFIENQNIDVIICSGGLGPTTDDITVGTFADYFKLKLYTSEKIVGHIKNIIGSNQEPSSYNKKQAVVPEESIILTNRNGTAPGIRFFANNKTIFLLPGPPSELNPMLIEKVIPHIKSSCKSKIFFESVYATGVAESELQRIVIENIPESNDLYVAYRYEPGCCEISFSSPFQKLASDSADKLKTILGAAVLKKGCKNIIEDIFHRLKEQKLSLGTAESCTGGMISSKITDIPGASAVFKGSVIAYSNEIKEKLLNVKKTTLEQNGAVSAECALEMAEGCCNNLNATASIAVTGIAGPDGGTNEKPVGLIVIAVKVKDKTVVHSYNTKGDRTRIRARTCSYAFNDLRNLLIKS